MAGTASERHTLSVSRASGLRVVMQLPTEACHRLGVPENTLKVQFQDHQRIPQTVRNQNPRMTAA